MTSEKVCNVPRVRLQIRRDVSVYFITRRLTVRHPEKKMCSCGTECVEQEETPGAASLNLSAAAQPPATGERALRKTAEEQ